MNIKIQTQPEERMRYATYGDYYDRGRRTYIDVVKQKNPLYEMLIAVHELVEYILVKARGISVDEIEQFDKADATDDPGGNPAAPYYFEHQFAENVERMLCAELGIKWADYERDLENMNYFSFQEIS